MKSQRIATGLAGALFFVATVAFLVGNGLIESVLNNPDNLINLSFNKTTIIAGVLLEVINSIAIVGIAILLFPILKKYNEAIALGYVGFRVIEAAILIIGAMSPLLLITLSQDYNHTGGQNLLNLQSISELAIRWHSLAFQLAMIVLGLYSLIFCYLLYQSKLVPRYLSILGWIGYSALVISAIAEIYDSSVGMVLYIPGALFEILFPLWLMVKGFNPTVNLEPYQPTVSGGIAVEAP